MIRNGKCLIAYFSREGKNYVNGRIVNLPVGNTATVAETIQNMTKGDLFRIEPVRPYPADYTEATRLAQKEKRENARPELSGRVADMASFTTVFLGYPNWWGTIPMPVCTFLEAYDFSGKTVIPFCTHEGSGLGSSERDIKKLCPSASLLPGIAVRGDRVKEAGRAIAEWLDTIGFRAIMNTRAE